VIPGVEVGTRVGVSIASRVSMERIVGVENTTCVGGTGVSVGGTGDSGVSVGSSAVRLQDVKAKAKIKIQ